MERFVLEIIRLEEDEEGTLGSLRINKRFLFQTFEPTDKENQVNVSSIPAQMYLCERYYSNKFKRELFRIRNVPGRSAVAFHNGRDEDDTAGCIILGLQPTHMGKIGVLHSRKALDVFMEILKDVDSFHLTIKECY